MLSLVVMLSVGMLPPAPGGPAPQPVAESAVVRTTGATGDDDAARQLASEPLEVAQTYEALLSKSKRDRMSAYGDLPSSMKSAIWIHRCLTALAQHPEFTQAQRAMLRDALALFTPELFEISPSSPDWSNRVDQPLRNLANRAKAAFGFGLAGKLFAQLEPDNPPAAAPPAREAYPELQQVNPQGLSQSPKTLRPVPDALPRCSCSTASDYCALEWGSDWYCLAGGCVWGTNRGCGTVLAYPCNGLCDLQQFQD